MGGISNFGSFRGFMACDGLLFCIVGGFLLLICCLLYVLVCRIGFGVCVIDSVVAGFDSVLL